MLFCIPKKLFKAQNFSSPSERSHPGGLTISYLMVRSLPQWNKIGDFDAKQHSTGEYSALAEGGDFKVLLIISKFTIQSQAIILQFYLPDLATQHI